MVRKRVWRAEGGIVMGSGKFVRQEGIKEVKTRRKLKINRREAESISNQRERDSEYRE